MISSSNQSKMASQDYGTPRDSRSVFLEIVRSKYSKFTGEEDFHIHTTPNSFDHYTTPQHARLQDSCRSH